MGISDVIPLPVAVDKELVNQTSVRGLPQIVHFSSSLSTATGRGMTSLIPNATPPS